MPPLSPYSAAWQVLVDQLCFLSTQYVSEVVDTYRSQQSSWTTQGEGGGPGGRFPREDLGPMSGARPVL